MNILKRTAFLSLRLLKNVRHTGTKLYEPDYLETMKSKVPLHDAINIQMRGYDYPILESYQKLVNRIATNMDINVEDAWATPAQHLNITTYKPNSEIVESKYALRNYERTVQVTDISGPQLQVLLRAVEACLPEGVTVQVVQHEDYHEEIRYIPDQDLKALKDELENIATKKK